MHNREITMFNLFKNKQREQFNKDYYQFVNEYDKLIELTKNSNQNKDNKDFIETTNRNILDAQELYFQLEQLNLALDTKLNPQTIEQEIKTAKLHTQITRAQITVQDRIYWFTSIRNAYQQGLNDGYNLEKD